MRLKIEKDYEALELIESGAIQLSLEMQMRLDIPKKIPFDRIEFSEEIFDEPKIVNAIIENNFTFRFNADELCKHNSKNFELAKWAIEKYHPECWLYFDKEVKEDPEILTMVAENGFLDILDPKFQDDFDVVTAAAKSDHSYSPMEEDEAINRYYESVQKGWEDGLDAFFGSKIETASPRLQNDPIIMLEAVKHNPVALLWGGPDVRKNVQIVETALKNVSNEKLYQELLKIVSPDIISKVKEDLPDFKAAQQMKLIELTREKEELSAKLAQLNVQIDTRKGINKNGRTK